MAFLIEMGVMIFLICLGFGIIAHGLVLVNIEKHITKNYYRQDGTKARR